MSATRYVCSVCGNVFTEHQARANPLDPEDVLACPKCGSTRVELDHFDPDEPVEELVEENEEQ